MARYTGADVIREARAAGADPPLARIMAAAALAEGGGDTEAVGDDGTSWGPYQINDIHGLSQAERTDLGAATRWMLANEFQRAYDQGVAEGLTGERLARWTCMAAERPYGWQGPDTPGLNTRAANRYAAHWRDLEGAMPETATRAYDATAERVVQTDDWSCSVAAAAWALHSLGVAIDYAALEQEELAAGVVSTGLGLLDATGGRLADWLAARFDLETGYDGGVRWAWLVEHAGQMPILLGGRHWGAEGHWVGVRAVADDGLLQLANPAEGYAGIFETLSEQQFANVGPCSAVWLAPEEDMARIAQLEGQVADAVNLLGNIQGDWVDAADAAIVEAETTEDPDQRAALLEAARASLATIKRGGPPAVEGA